MSNKKIHIYLLPLYANKENLEENRYKTEHESRIQFSKNNLGETSAQNVPPKWLLQDS